MEECTLLLLVNGVRGSTKAISHSQMLVRCAFECPTGNLIYVSPVRSCGWNPGQLRTISRRMISPGSDTIRRSTGGGIQNALAMDVAPAHHPVRPGVASPVAPSDTSARRFCLAFCRRVCRGRRARSAERGGGGGRLFCQGVSFVCLVFVPRSGVALSRPDADTLPPRTCRTRQINDKRLDFDFDDDTVLDSGALRALLFGPDKDRHVRHDRV